MLLIHSGLMGRNLPFQVAVPPRLIVPNHILLVGIVFAFLLVRIAFVFFKWKASAQGPTNQNMRKAVTCAAEQAETATYP